jgi:hypothetical protein
MQVGEQNLATGQARTLNRLWLLDLDDQFRILPQTLD